MVGQRFKAEDVLGEAWQRLSEAANDLVHPMRLFTLATVSAEGHAAARLMMLRGADRASGSIWCHTHAGSPKTIEIRASPWYSAVFYDKRDALQLRIEGRATMHEMDATARDHFEQASQAAPFRTEALQAARQATPGPDLLWPAAPEPMVRSIKLEASRRFAVISMQVETIDWLQALGTVPTQFRLTAATDWVPEPVGK